MVRAIRWTFLSFIVADCGDQRIARAEIVVTFNGTKGNPCLGGIYIPNKCLIARAENMVTIIGIK